MRDINGVEHASIDFISASLDSQVTSEEAAWLRAHLEQCAACASEHASLRELRAALIRLPVFEPPRSFVLPEPIRVLRFPRLTAVAQTLAAIAAVAFVMLFAVDMVGLSTEAIAPAVVQTSAAKSTTGAAESRQAIPADAAAARQVANPPLGALIATPAVPVAFQADAAMIPWVRIAAVTAGGLTLALLVAALALRRTRTVRVAWEE